MLAYGKLNRDLMAGGYSQGRLGFEFSGTLPAPGAAPRRVMGVARQAIATSVGAPQYLVRAHAGPDLGFWVTLRCTYRRVQACGVAESACAASRQSQLQTP